MGGRPVAVGYADRGTSPSNEAASPWTTRQLVAHRIDEFRCHVINETCRREKFATSPLSSLSPAMLPRRTKIEMEVLLPPAAAFGRSGDLAQLKRETLKCIV